MDLLLGRMRLQLPHAQQRTSDTGIPTTWRSSYDAKLTEWVREFQKFCKLEVNGRSDYQTSARLPFSMGDPDRDVTGSDTR
ncbi:hypothetical protein SBADM41S_12300 [Streptomyces badius]